MVHDCDVATKKISFVHVVGCEDNGAALGHLFD